MMRMNIWRKEFKIQTERTKKKRQLRTEEWREKKKIIIRWSRTRFIRLHVDKLPEILFRMNVFKWKCKNDGYKGWGKIDVHTHTHIHIHRHNSNHIQYNQKYYKGVRMACWYYSIRIYSMEFLSDKSIAYLRNYRKWIRPGLDP